MRGIAMTADKTAPKQQIGRPFEAGASGNPAGRPKGSRNKLSEAFLKALADDFDANGPGVIERVRKERPHDYLKVCASVMPKRVESEEVTERKDPRTMSDAELEAFIWKASDAMGGLSAEEVAAAETRLSDRRQHTRIRRQA